MKSICGGIRKSCLFAMLWGTALAFAVETNSVWVDYRDACVVSGALHVASSSGDASASPKVDGAVASGWTVDAPAWDTSSVADGWHVLSIAGESATPEVLTVNDESIAVHEGILQSDEVWGADKVHVVRDWVRIPEGKRLVIANGAVVKFCKDSGILNQGTLSAVSAVLTAIEDDTVGGDTNLDGSASSPVANSYAIQNEGTLNAINNAMRYATAGSVFASTSISENAFRGCDEITEIIVPADVVSVAGNAFGNCGNLKDVTFLGSETGVARNAFDGCSSVETVNFPGGMPDSEFPVGRSNPTVYVNDNALPETWSGYTVVDVYAGGILEKTLLVPAEEGEVGQVLTVTEDGYEWKDIPVDGELNADSTNAVQNKVVTAAINELQDADEALAGDVADLQSVDTALQGKVITLTDRVADLETETENVSTRLEGQQTAIVAMQSTDAILNNSVTNLKSDVSVLQGANSATQVVLAELRNTDAVLNGGITELKGNVLALQATDATIKNSVTMVKNDVIALKNKDTELEETDTAMQSDIATLQETVDGMVGVPTEEGEVGQVLTKTEDGIEWQTINVTVDAELDAKSENSVQNKVVTAAVNELKEADEGLGDDISTLSSDLDTQTQALTATAAAQQSVTSALQSAVNSQSSAVSALQSKAENARLNINSLQLASNATQTTLAAHLSSIEILQSDMGATKSDIGTLKSENASLKTENQTLRNDVDALSQKVELLLAILDGGKEYDVLTKGGDGGYSWQPADFGGEVMKISLAEGWNLVAMPGRIVFDESSASAINDIEIYTYDKKQKVYVQSEGLEPLASYWMRAPKACTIHFLVVDEKNQQTQE